MTRAGSRGRRARRWCGAAEPAAAPARDSRTDLPRVLAGCPKAEGTAGTCPPVASGQVHGAALFRANNRTAVHFVRHNESDFRMGSGRSRQDLLVRGELVRRESRVENDEDLLPQGIEPVTLDGIDHRSENLLLVQIVRSVDRVDARVVREQRAFGAGRHLFHIDGDLLTIVESGHLTCSAIHASLSCARHVRLTHGAQNEQQQRKGDEDKCTRRFPSDAHIVPPSKFVWGGEKCGLGPYPGAWPGKPMRRRTIGRHRGREEAGGGVPLRPRAPRSSRITSNQPDGKKAAGWLNPLWLQARTGTRAS